LPRATTPYRNTEHMWIYLIKRLLAMIPTLLGVLTLTFIVTQLVPGGPIDQVMAQFSQETSRSSAEGSASGGWSYSGRQGVDASQIAALSQQFGFDQPPLE